MSINHSMQRNSTCKLCPIMMQTLGCPDEWPFRKYMWTRARTKYTGEHSANVWSQRRSPLMKSPSAKINSVTFEVMLSTHYSRGQLKEEEEKDEEGGRRVRKQSTHGPGWIMQPLKWSFSPAVAWSGMWHLTYESTIADHRLDRPHHQPPRSTAAAELW